MLSEELRIKLSEKMRKNPKEVIRVLEEEPKILEALLNSDKEAEVERVKYINMTTEMQRQLQQKAKQLQITQGVLMGAGILLLLSLMEK